LAISRASSGACFSLGILGSEARVIIRFNMSEKINQPNAARERKRRTAGRQADLQSAGAPTVVRPRIKHAIARDIYI
jgi:hypothetical protein